MSRLLTPEQLRELATIQPIILGIEETYGGQSPTLLANAQKPIVYTNVEAALREQAKLQEQQDNYVRNDKSRGAARYRVLSLSQAPSHPTDIPRDAPAVITAVAKPKAPTAAKSSYRL